ncbi:hypothetical protein L1987_08527 [Smallanthus sonchifolius]|uniref:Uncharacterized protein n=1 Tax=Smallanthus sonchifolius TaxID=185202 RepID=A0ACB9JLE9_9ASTR|nr:hypothetical protein L1987_08527 [Smallanthus sonchifolius]
MLGTQLSWMTTTRVVMEDTKTTMSTSFRRFGVRYVGNPTTLKIVITIKALDSDSWTLGNLFHHLEEIKVQIIKSYPNKQQDDSFKVQESEIIVPTSLVRSSDSKEQEPSNCTSIDQSKVRPNDSEERVTATLQSLLDFSEKMEAKQSKEPRERRSKE